MRTLLLVLLMASICSLGFAESKMLPLKAGIAYSIQESKINHAETLQLVEWKGVDLQAGYSGEGDDSDHKIIAAITYDLFKLKKYTSIPILDLVEFRPGLWAGYGDINTQELDRSKFDWGVIASLISYKF